MSRFELPAPAEPMGLADWLDERPRAEAGREPFFRGRREEFAEFARSARLLLSPRFRGQGLIVQGAPGAGKTALLQECMEAVRNASTQEAPWVPVLLHSDDFASGKAFARGFAKALAAEAETLQGRGGALGRLFQKVRTGAKTVARELRDRGVNVHLPGVEVSLGSRAPTAGAAGALTGSEAFDLASGALSEAALSDAHIVAFTDEAQNITPSEASKGVVSRMHQGIAGLRLLPVFCGLNDTRATLARCGLSRIDGLILLRPLPIGDAEDSLLAAFAEFGFRGAARERWVQALAAESQGWPQHLRVIAQAAAKTVHANGGRFDGLPLENALRKAREAKAAYYESRLEAAPDDCLEIYKRIAMEADGSGVIDRGTLQRLVARPLREIGMTRSEFLHRTLYAGVLSSTTPSREAYQFPIPSMVGHLRGLPVEPTPLPEEAPSPSARHGSERSPSP